MKTTAQTGLLIAAALFLCNLCGLPGAAAEQTGDDVSAGIDAVRQALRQWDFAAMTEAASLLGGTRGQGQHGEFWRHYWRGTALFHAVLYLREGDPSAARTRSTAPLREEARACLAKALSLRPEDGESHAMIAVLQGLAISDRPIAALWRGRDFAKHKEAACESGQVSPRITYLLGVSTLQRAGDDEAVQAALENLLEAAALFQAERGQPGEAWAPRWGYDHAQMFVGAAYEQLGDLEKASSWYKQAKSTNPNLARAEKGYERCRKQMANESR